MARPTPVKIADQPPWTGWIPIVIVAVTFAAFAWACGSEFVTWDDQLHVYENPGLNPATLASLGAFWAHPYQNLYIPLTYTMWWLIAQAPRVPMASGSGTEFNPWIFHSASVLLQCITALLVYRLLRALAGKDVPAAAGALLWAVHPLQVESVAWVSAGKDQLCGALAIGALILLLTPKAEQSKREGLRRDGLATVLFAAALLAKPAAAALPLMAGVLVFYFPHRAKRWRWLGLWIGLALIDVLITKYAQPVTMPADGGRWWLRPMIAGDALEFYLLKLIVPIRLAIQYNRTPITVIAAGWKHMTWAVPAIALVIAWIIRRRFPFVLAGLLVFIAGLLPVLGLLPFVYQSRCSVADHYAHLALLGPAVALAWGLCAVPKRWEGLAWSVAGAGVLVLGGLSVAQTLVWKDSITLYSHALEVNPRSWVSDQNLGDIYEAGNDGYEALPYLEKALQYQTHSAPLYIDYADALATTHRFAAAEAAYRTAERINPHSPALQDNWAHMRELRQQWIAAHGPATVP